jgi:hypothetical protein
LAFRLSIRIAGVKAWRKALRCREHTSASEAWLPVSHPGAELADFTPENGRLSAISGRYSAFFLYESGPLRGPTPDRRLRHTEGAASERQQRDRSGFRDRLAGKVEGHVRQESSSRTEENLPRSGITPGPRRPPPLGRKCEVRHDGQPVGGVGRRLEGARQIDAVGICGKSVRTRQEPLPGRFSSKNQ